MKIGVDAKFAPPHYGGLGTYSIKIIDALCRLGDGEPVAKDENVAGELMGSCPADLAVVLDEHPETVAAGIDHLTRLETKLLETGLPVGEHLA